MTDPAVGYHFNLTVDNRPLGVFTKVEGLVAKYDMLSIKEGGQNGFVQALPGRVSYELLKVTRPIDGDSGRIAAWFSEFQSVLQTGGRLNPVTASITAFGPDDQVVARWDLQGVYPSSYSGPSFQAGASSVLTEVLTLYYQSFAPAGGASAAPSPAGQAMSGLANVGPALGAGASI